MNTASRPKTADQRIADRNPQRCGTGANELIPYHPALRLQLAAIAGNEPASSFIEVRSLDPPGSQVFVPVRDLDQAARVVERLRDDHQAYVGVAPRTRRAGNASAVERVWTLWADLDQPESVERIRRFWPSPSIVVCTSPGRFHCYWPLRRPIPGAWAQRANRRLALALHADPASTDCARVLRPIGSLNRKDEPPTEVECVRLEIAVFALEQVVTGLPDDREYALQPLSASRRSVSGLSAPGRLDGLARAVREAPTGNRNNTLFWAACRARESGGVTDLDLEQALAALRDAAVTAGLDEVEVDRTLRSTLDAGSAA